jgi:hypothetical protein
LTDRGRVLIFTESGGSWSQKGSTIEKIFSGTEVAYRRLGESVHIQDGGEELAIGSQPNWGSSTGLNRAYLFNFSSAAVEWYLAQSISGKSREEDDGFGENVSFSSDGSKLMVSAKGYSATVESVTSYSGGYAQLFEKETTYSIFVPVEEIDTSGSSADNVSMSADGSTVVYSGYPGAFLVTANNTLTATAEGGASGDPCVTNCRGTVFKLPASPWTYRLLQTQNFVLDGYVDVFPKKYTKSFKNHFQKHSWVSSDVGDLSFLHGYYFTKFRLFDRESQKMTTLNEMGVHLSGPELLMKSSRANQKRKRMLCPVQGSLLYSERQIRLDNTLVCFRQFKNPQILNGVYIKVLGKGTQEVSGLLVQGHYKKWRVGKRGKFFDATQSSGAQISKNSYAVPMNIKREKKLFVSHSKLHFAAF